MKKERTKNPPLSHSNVTPEQTKNALHDPNVFVPSLKSTKKHKKK